MNTYSLTIFLVYIFTLFSFVYSDSPISRINKYSLSYDYIDKISTAILDSSLQYYSLPNEIKIEKPHPFLRVKSQKQTLLFNLYGALSGQLLNNGNLGYFLLGSNVDYESRFLDAGLLVECYNTKEVAYGRMNDVEHERFIFTNEKEKKSIISGMFDFRFNLPQAWLKLKIESFSVTTGKLKLRWGPGYKGTLGISGINYSPFYYYLINLDIKKIIHFSSFLSGYDDEIIYDDEVTISDTMEIINNGIKITTLPPRYGAGQRIDFRFGKYVQFGIYEFVDFFGANDLNRYANPLQIYFLGLRTSATNNENLIGGCDLNLCFKKFRIYAEFLNDDITVFEDAGNPNKYAYQFGADYYFNLKLQKIGFEYTHIARYVYGHSRVLNRHAIWGRPIGWPYGNDQDLFHFHSIFNIHEKVKAKYEFNFWLKGDGEIEDDWYADGAPDLDHAPYWPVNADKIITMIFNVEYKPFYWLTTSLYYRPIINNKKVSNDIHLFILADIPGKKVVDFEKKKMK